MYNVFIKNRTYSRKTISFTGVPSVPIYIASSITTSEHASYVRTYQYHQDTGTLQDMSSFYMRPKNTSEEEPVWKAEYNFTILYNVDNLSAESLGFVLDEFTLEGSKRFENYFVHLRHDGPEVGCNMTCQLTFYCAATQVDYEKFDDCIDELIYVEEEMEPARFTMKLMLVVFYSMLVLFFFISSILIYLFCCKPKRANRMYSPLPNYIQM